MSKYKLKKKNKWKNGLIWAKGSRVKYFSPESDQSQCQIVYRLLYSKLFSLIDLLLLFFNY